MITDFGRTSFVTHTTSLVERVRRARMRQYRGIPIAEKLFVYGWLFMLDDHAYIIPLSDNFTTPSSFICGFIEVIPETVGQQAGRKDKNGKEIYDGDILPGQWIVMWWPEQAQFVLGNGSLDVNKAAKEEFVIGLLNSDEVLGNIHQHQQLLEQEDA